MFKCSVQKEMTENTDFSHLEKLLMIKGKKKRKD